MATRLEQELERAELGMEKADEAGDTVDWLFRDAVTLADKEEAEKKKIEVEYITQIVAECNGKVVYEVSTSGFMSENPLINFCQPQYIQR